MLAVLEGSEEEEGVVTTALLKWSSVNLTV
jgi:hypothetical protein